VSIRLYLLGSPRVEQAGRMVSFDTRKALALLACLALSPGTQRREALATLFWPDYEQSRAFANLRRTLWSLKKGIGEAYLEIDEEAVTLVQDEIWSDAKTFRSLLAEVDNHEHEEIDRCTACLSSLQSAVALYTGDLLSGFTIPDSPPFDEWLFFEAESLRQDLGRALHRLAQMYRARGEPEDAIPYARRWLALDPLHEPAQRMLMSLYAEAGQHAAAMRQYEECKRVLGEELGMEPEKETTHLYLLIRNRQIGPQSAIENLVQEPILTHPVLPVELTAFVGRQQERQAIAGLLKKPSCWLLTLTGPGGIGKTRLALRVARELTPDFPGGIYWVELDALHDAALVLPAIARKIEVREEAEGDLLTPVISALRARGKALLLLDNFEHVLDAAPLLSQIHCAAPQVAFLATSRERLHLYGEQEYPITPLGLPVLSQDGTYDSIYDLAENEAVALFVQQAAAAKPDFRLTQENGPVVAALCRRLDGIPLAIELAAARIKLYSPKAMLAHLETHRSVDWLKGGAHGRPSRQRSLYDTLDWSYALLAPEEQALLSQLAIFAGGFTLSAAAEICGSGIDTVERVAALVDKSLLQSVGEVANQPRFGMLQPIHEFAADLLERSGDSPAIASRHFNYFLDLAERAEPQLKGSAQIEWLERLEADQGNLRAALTWVTQEGIAGELAQRLANALLWFWHGRDRVAEGRRWLQLALAMEQPAHAEVRARALNAEGFLASHQGDWNTAQALLEESISICREHKDSQNLAYALSWQSAIQWNLRLRWSLEAESETLFRKVGDKWGLAYLLGQHGTHYLWFVRDIEEARKRLEASVALYLEIGDRWWVYGPYINLGDVAAAEGNFQEADALYAKALDICRQIADSSGVAWALHSLGRSAMANQRYEEASDLLQQCFHLYQRCGWRQGLCYTRLDMGTLARLQGKFDQAQAFISESLELAHNIGLQPPVSFAPQELGYALAYAGKYRQAIPHFEKALRLGREDFPLHAALAVPGVASVAAAMGEGQRAAHLLRAAETLGRTVIRRLGFTFNREEYERHLTLARDLLRAHRLITEMESEMSEEAAFDHALREAPALVQIVERDS
jgi:predicted ATPase/DNA-binding SARP family transcriptional activator